MCRYGFPVCLHPECTQPARNTDTHGNPSHSKNHALIRQLEQLHNIAISKAKLIEPKERKKDGKQNT